MMCIFGGLISTSQNHNYKLCKQLYLVMKLLALKGFIFLNIGKDLSLDVALFAPFWGNI
jgi:hypothetical protein